MTNERKEIAMLSERCEQSFQYDCLLALPSGLFGGYYFVYIFDFFFQALAQAHAYLGVGERKMVNYCSNRSSDIKTLIYLF